MENEQQGRAKKATRVTMKDVAERAGINYSSVSVVLNGARSGTGVSEKTRQRILQAAAELNYRANPHAQRLVRGDKDRTVALFSVRMDCPTASRKLSQMQSLLRDIGFDAPLHSYGIFNEFNPVNQAPLMAEICQGNPDAVICHTSGIEAAAVEELRRFQNAGGTVVCFDESFTSSRALGLEEFDRVIFHVAASAYKAARYLMERGHSKIGLFRTDPAGVPSDVEDSFFQALGEFGLTPQKEWLFNGYGPEAGGANMAEQFLQVESAQWPTAMCIGNNYAAATFMTGLARNGVLLPQELSIISLDDAPIAPYCTVPLTTVSHCNEEVAEQVVLQVRSRLEKNSKDSPLLITLSGEVIERESVVSLTASHRKSSSIDAF